jgi:glycosyltransferase involved in cell wall biosynthesis
VNGDALSRPRIVIAGDFCFFSTTQGLADGFRALGWDVHEVDIGSYSPHPKTIAGKIWARLTVPYSVIRYNRGIIATVKAVRPHGFLTVKGRCVAKKTLRMVRDCGVRTVNYYPDARFSFPGIDEAIFSDYDRFYTTKAYQVDYLKSRLGADKVELLHHGYLSGVHTPMSDPQADPPIDVLYVGNHTEEKESWLCAVKRRFPEIRMCIFGNRWNNIKGRDILTTSIAGTPLYGAEYAAAIHAAKINLGIHMGITDNSGWYDRVSTRTFEIPACKGFMLHVDNEDVRQLFTPGVEIDVFKDEDELCSKIDYYLAHDEIRREMLERAYNRCVPAYSYDERARIIADWIKRGK